MRSLKATLLSTAMLALAAGNQAQAQTAEVLNWWTSGSESAAVKVLADTYEKLGGKWVNIAVVGGPAARALGMNRIAGGNAATAMQWNVGVTTQQLAQQGLLANLDDLAAQGKWNAALPKLILSKVMVDGHFYAIPIDVAGVNWVFYSKKIFDELKITPPKSWDEFFQTADKIKQAGYIPFAMGGQPWQEELLMQSVILGVGGPDFFRKVFVEHDAAAAGSATMVKSFDVLRRITQYTDAGASNRKWNDTTLLVEQNKAAMQIMGDWAKAEFQSAGLKLGTDFGCAPAPGTAGSYTITVDVFVFPKIDKPEAVAAQRKLATMLMDPAVQVAFNQVKGALPPRTDAAVSEMDVCDQIGHQVIVDHPDQIMPNMQLAFSSDDEGQISDLVTQFWSTPSMSSADAAKQFAAIVGNAAK